MALTMKVLQLSPLRTIRSKCFLGILRWWGTGFASFIRHDLYSVPVNGPVSATLSLNAAFSPPVDEV